MNFRPALKLAKYLWTKPRKVASKFWNRSESRCVAIVAADRRGVLEMVRRCVCSPAKVLMK